MSTEIEYKIREFVKDYYIEITKKPNQVLDIFNNFFGEEYVDMQGIDFDTFYEYIIHSDIGFYTSSSALVTLSTSTIDSTSLDTILEKIKKDNYSRLSPYIYSVFKPTILIHFPKVRIENEYNQHVDITHLYAKVVINFEGVLVGSFSLNRSEYYMSHFQSNYMHSHICCIPKSDFKLFQLPCLGSGPIRTTIASLNVNYDEDLWSLFCLELSKYVATESVSGGPYHRMDKIGKHGLSKLYAKDLEVHNICNFYFFSDFIKELILSKKLKFSYCNNSYSIGMSFIDWTIFISNEFISWFNREYNKKTFNSSFNYNTLIDDGIIKISIISNNEIYYVINHSSTIQRFQNSFMCKFKGKDVNINIIEDNDDNKVTYRLLNNSIVLYILNIILKVLNYRYGRENTETNTTSTKTRYLF